MTHHFRCSSNNYDETWRKELLFLLGYVTTARNNNTTATLYAQLLNYTIQQLAHALFCRNKKSKLVI